MKKPFVLFICKHNTGRSQMAEAYVRRFAHGRLDVASAGTIAASEPDPGVVRVMAEDGVDISSAVPKLLDPAMIDRADRIITMGCDVVGVGRIDADWNLPDPKGATLEDVRAIRDRVKGNAADLVREFGIIPGPYDALLEGRRE